MASERLTSRLIAVALSTVLAALAACAGGPGRAPDARPTGDDAVLDDLEHRTFEFFWRTADPATGLVPDRYPTPSFSSIAAVGFGLTAYPVGVERGYVTRTEARDRVRTTLKFFRDAPQGDAAHGMTGYKGFYYHFLDMKTGQRYQDVELSSVDTALLLAGVLFCREYFAGADPAETELRQIADALLARVDWTWMQPRGPGVAMGWRPEQGFLDNDWIGYNEAMIGVRPPERTGHQPHGRCGRDTLRGFSAANAAGPAHAAQSCPSARSSAGIRTVALRPWRTPVRAPDRQQPRGAPSRRRAAAREA